MFSLCVILPTKNRRRLLERALKSVALQSYTNYRIVVIDDGSADDTEKYLASLRNPRLTVIRNPASLGVNAARNAALRTLKEGEWAVLLDDDDMLLPNALSIITDTILSVPSSVSLLYFNTIRHRLSGDSATGQRFGEKETWRDLSYEDIMLRRNQNGDSRPVMKWTLFPKYFFAEDVNGMESEWLMRLSRDGIGIRYVPAQTTWIDQAHGGEHLRLVAARRDPASFARAHWRVLRDHAAFFAAHPRSARERSLAGLKLALRAFNVSLAVRFACRYLQASGRLVFWLGAQQENDPKQDAERVGDDAGDKHAHDAVEQ